MSETQNQISISWKMLLRRLERQKAILLLGPEVAMAAADNPLPMQEALQNYIQEDLKGLLEEEELKKIKYYSEDGFFHLEDDYKSEVIYPILQYYQELPVSPLYQKLAQLPFHLILSLSPDKLLCRAFDQLNLPYHFHYYDKKRYNKTADDEKLNFTPSGDDRLIYNIFGSIDSEGSLILSYDDLFEFLQKIFNNYSLPETIRESILDANYFVFIGFNYGKWYLKLLLRLMNMHEKVKKVYGMDRPGQAEIETFFVNEFDMNFTSMKTKEFVDELYEKCREADLLISPGSASSGAKRIPVEIRAEMETMIGKDQIKESLRQLAIYCREGKLPQEVCTARIQLSARLEKLSRDQTLGIVDYKEFTLERNKLVHQLLELLNSY